MYKCYAMTTTVEHIFEPFQTLICLTTIFWTSSESCVKVFVETVAIHLETAEPYQQYYIAIYIIRILKNVDITEYIITCSQWEVLTFCCVLSRCWLHGLSAPDLNVNYQIHLKIKHNADHYFIPFFLSIYSIFNHYITEPIAVMTNSQAIFLHSFCHAHLSVCLEIFV